MGGKIILVMDDAYDALISLKAPDESFSDEIRRLTKTRGSILDFAGAWKDISEEKAAKLKARITERRQDTRRMDEIHKKR